MSEITAKRKLKDTLDWGFILWLIGFALGMMLFPFVPAKFIGLPILAVFIPLAIFIAYKRFKNFDAPTLYYLLVAIVWLGIALIMDYVFIVKAFKPENYYDFDVMVYYLATFLIPLIIGLKYGAKDKMSVTKINILKKFLADSDYIYKNWRQADIDNFSTKIFDRGSGPILFNTPIAKHLEPFWAPILKHFEKTHRVITFERRESISAYMNAEDKADDIKRVLDYLGISRCDFVSHSSGAIATLHFAIRYPKMVNSLVLMNVAAYYSKWQKLQVKILSNIIAQLFPDSLVLSWFLYYLAEKNIPEYEVHKYAFSQFRPLKKYIKYSLNHIILGHDIRDALQTIKPPVLLINRTNDRIVNIADMEYICKNLPNCYGLKKVTGGGHMFHYFRAQEIIKFMEEFYSKLRNIKNHSDRTCYNKMKFRQS